MFERKYRDLMFPPVAFFVLLSTAYCTASYEIEEGGARDLGGGDFGTILYPSLGEKN